MTLVRRSRVSIISTLGVLVVRVIISSVLGLLLFGGVRLVLSGLVILTALRIAFTSFRVAWFVTRCVVHVVVIVVPSLFIETIWTEVEAIGIIKRFVRKDVEAHLVGIPSILVVLPLLVRLLFTTIVVVLTFNVSWLLIIVLESWPLVVWLRISRLFISCFSIFLLTTGRW